jgi:excisionase family DNA binding protein
MMEAGMEQAGEKARGEWIAAQFPQDSGLMEYRDVARYLKMTEGTIRHWVMKDEVPCFKIGASVRFSRKQIDKWLLDNYYQGPPSYRRRRSAALIAATPDEVKAVCELGFDEGDGPSSEAAGGNDD